MSTSSLADLRGRLWPRSGAPRPRAAAGAAGRTRHDDSTYDDGHGASPDRDRRDDRRPASRRGRLARLALGHEDDPRWSRPALWALLLATAVLYLWNLSNSGYANEFYAAAVKSGTKDLTAWLFGSLDSANAITVDKPPVALWLMVLSCRIFGFSSFAMLLPQALAGVGTVALTAASVRRACLHATDRLTGRTLAAGDVHQREGSVSAHVAGLVAGALVALTPVAALMFRFNNPDALLVLLMAAAAYFTTRAVETTRGRAALGWMIGCGLAIGFAFLTKMLQGLLVVPGFALAYLVAGRSGLAARIRHLLAAAVAMVVGAGWFVALVALWPASSRPYIGGSTNNSLWELALGYNGLGRILGGSGNGGGGGGGGGNTGFGGATGITRLFGSSFGAEISWLLPTALVLLVAGLVTTARRPRTDTVRAALIVWGGWLIVSGIVLSYMKGTVHPYYSVALAPGIAAVVALGGREAWARRDSLVWRVVLGAAVALAGVWSVYLLHVHADSWLPALRWVALGVTALGVMGFIALGGEQRFRRAAAVALLIGSLGGLTGTAAWTVATASQGHNGSIPTSGPSVAGGQGGPGGGHAGGQRPGGTQSKASTGTAGRTPTSLPGTSGSSGSASGTSSSTGASTSTGTSSGSSSSTSSSSTTSVSSLLRNAGTKWSAAVIGDQTAAGYILDSDTAVMSIGGWSGSDANVTLAQFQQYVSSGQIHYFISGGQGGQGGGPGGSTGSSAQITAWVKAHFTATTVGGATVYDLTKATS